MSKLIYRTEKGASARCQSVANAVNRALQVQLGIAGGACAPCSTPGGIPPTCCCSCYQVTFSDDGSSSAFKGKTFNMTQGFFICQTPPSPADDTACGWYTPSSSGSSSSAETYPTFVTHQRSILGYDVGALVYVNDYIHENAAYTSTDFQCGTGGTFTLSTIMEGTIGGDPDPIGYYPSTCIVVPISCNPSSSSSGSSSSGSSSGSSSSGSSSSGSSSSGSSSSGSSSSGSSSSESSSSGSSSSGSSSSGSSSSGSSSSPSSSSCGVMAGRATQGTTVGIGTSYLAGFTGGASVAGIDLIAVLFDSSQDGASSSISGGTAWTRLGAGTTATIPGLTIWHKVTGASEPATYTISYAGATSSESACCGLLEILNAPAGLIGLTYIANSSTPQTITVTQIGQLAIVAAVGEMIVSSPPSGFTSQTSVFTGGTPTGAAAIATQVTTSLGTLSPGSWGLTSSANNYLFTLLFGC